MLTVPSSAEWSRQPPLYPCDESTFQTNKTTKLAYSF